jgi:hypothetical protein
MQTLSAARHDLIDQAAALVPERQRGLFLMQLRAAMLAERQLSDRRFKQLLCEVVGRFGINIRPSFFNPTIAGGGNHAASNLATSADRHQAREGGSRS